MGNAGASTRATRRWACPRAFRSLDLKYVRQATVPFRAVDCCSCPQISLSKMADCGAKSRDETKSAVAADEAVACDTLLAVDCSGSTGGSFS